MRYWTSIHGIKACELHGMKRQDMYVADGDAILFDRGSEIHIVDRPGFDTTKLTSGAFLYQVHDAECEDECSGKSVPWYKSGPGGGLPTPIDPTAVTWLKDPPAKPVPHPAKFSDAVLRKIDQLCEMYEIGSLVDPFAGTCKIFDICPSFIVGLEIEREWLVQGPRWNKRCRVQGNALHLPFKKNAFKATGTSITYGNRMADSHDAKEKCKMCGGVGFVPYMGAGNGDDHEACLKCKGAGFNTYKRLTYTHQLGHELHLNNSGKLQWGQKYRDFHVDFLAEMTRVTSEYFILNVSDHIRGGEVVPVCQWFVETVTAFGWLLVEAHKIETPRMRMGANHEARVDYEMVYLFRKNDVELQDN